MEHEEHLRQLPANHGAPARVLRWQKRGLAVFAIFGALALIDAFVSHSFDYVLRGWLMALMMCLSFAMGGLLLLMLQWVTGGKWGLLTRRPLEAMTRTLPLIVLMFLPIGFWVKRLYLWARIGDPEAALHKGVINMFQAHAISYKRPYLNIEGFWIRAMVYFIIMGIFTYYMNRWSLQRDSDTKHGNWYWQKRFENLGGAGLAIYSFMLCFLTVDWVMSLDPTWYSSMYGFLFLVSQAYAGFAMVILIVLALSQDEPMNVMLRVTEQHDLGKLCFAFVMLNIYVAFSQYLLIWAGNLPMEIRWYLDRTTGGWGVVAGLDFLFHWVLPFSLLLSRDIKRNKKKLATVCCIMLFARYLDTFWLIAPNFASEARNFHVTFGMLQYILVPAAMTGLWVAYLCVQLRRRSLVALNDPHMPGLLEREHVSA